MGILDSIIGAIVGGIIKMAIDSGSRGKSSRKYGSEMGEIPTGGGAGGDSLTTTQESTQTYPHVQDPNYWPMSQYLMAQLMKNYQMKSGAGMPGGVGSSAGTEDWMASILEYLKGNLDTSLSTIGRK